MSAHHPAPGRAARPVTADPEDAEILEIFPGASTVEPIRTGNRARNRTRSRVNTRARLFGSERGMATAEYAIATLAAVGFAGILVFIMRSDEVRGFLLNLIRTALALP
ncbi:DUF4244 domain-containing protein [Arthrobacter sp. EPSL27]|uniref:DUF4244 domain-containing protein n=1 Tax=Arthrobacter sp. EPSL27 TaxID=1745378 RepID=UPI000749B3F4|nr:DUF4244 domain-containing protein [Arthrobacter sp. EPSL27]KUM33450.1 hypothetical protein AR539_16070 [Arthrobacter sp. EPSL27]